MTRLAILGGGSWGTALSISLAARFQTIGLWVRRPELAASMQAGRENLVYLPGFPLPANVAVTGNAATALDGADLVLSVLPSFAVRHQFLQFGSSIHPGLPVISATKGLEQGSLLRISSVIAEVTGTSCLAVLSGPSFASEVAAGCPTAVVVASDDEGLAKAVQEAFSGGSLRVYTSSDPIGVELGGAFKNVIAIGAGVCQGLALGQNAVAALITRGLAEMTRLALAMGALPQTLAGLSGLGDLVLTCTGNLSRNRMVGFELASGKTIGHILASMNMVAEGVHAAGSILSLGLRYGVDLPIVGQMNAVLQGGTQPRDAIRRLMERSLREE